MFSHTKKRKKKHHENKTGCKNFAFDYIIYIDQGLLSVLFILNAKNKKKKGELKTEEHKQTLWGDNSLYGDTDADCEPGPGQAFKTVALLKGLGVKSHGTTSAAAAQMIKILRLGL